MKTALYIVADVSGSMSESGKYLITRGVVHGVAQFCRLGYGHADLQLVAWGTKARVVEWNSRKEFPAEMLLCNGGANVGALTALLGEQPVSKILLLTDGFWPHHDTKSFKRWLENLQQDTLRVIKIGADANPQLKGAYVFAAEDLFAALDCWLEGAAE